MRNFDPYLTLIDSAQVFHWTQTEDGYAAVVAGRVMTDADDDAKARRYFADDREYAALAKECADFPIAAMAIEKLPGLRVLNQPPWEALIAFILSANNNVKRIRGLVTALCRRYGDRYSFHGETLYGFPEPQTLAKLDVDMLRTEVTCGYRADYLVETSRMVRDGFPLDELADMPLAEARKALQTLKGVGPKVADCVLLFGCGHTDAFPVDVWVDRLMRSWFGVTGSRAFMADEARRLLGDNCGLIQQALFHAARTGRISL